MRTLALFLCIVAVSGVWGGLYGPKSDVIELNKNNFANLVFGSEHIWLVEFYAPWCGHCKNLAPEYDKAATTLKGIVRLGAVNCDEEKNKELCGAFGVKGFPTIKFFPHILTEVPSQKGAYHKVPTDYQSARTAAAIQSFALSNLPNFVTSVTSSSYEKFSEGINQNGEKVGQVLLFTNKDKTTDLYKALAIDYHHRLLLGEVKHTEKKLVDQFGVTTFPTLLVVPEDGSSPVKYDGALKHEALFKFLSNHAKPAPNAGQQPEEPAAKKAPPPPPPRDTGEVLELRDQAIFDKRCGGLCAIAFLDTDFETEESVKDREKYLAVLSKVGVKYAGKVPLVWTEAKNQPDFVKALDVSSNYPTLIVINPNRMRFSLFMGALREDSISDFFEGVLSGSKRSIPLDTLPKIQTISGEHKEKSGKEEL